MAEPIPDADRVSIRTLVTIWILFFINLFNYIDRYIVAGQFTIEFRKIDTSLSKNTVSNNL